MKYLILTTILSLSAMANSMQCSGWAEIGEQFAGGYYVEFRMEISDSDKPSTAEGDYVNLKIENKISDGISDVVPQFHERFTGEAIRMNMGLAEHYKFAGGELNLNYDMNSSTYKGRLKFDSVLQGEVAEVECRPEVKATPEKFAWQGQEELHEQLLNSDQGSELKALEQAMKDSYKAVNVKVDRVALNDGFMPSHSHKDKLTVVVTYQERPSSKPTFSTKMKVLTIQAYQLHLHSPSGSTKTITKVESYLLTFTQMPI